jgi:DNA invertase Pin-like site-specific DNA recombinase
VCRLDRLGRSLAHLIDTVAELGKRGVNFESLADRIDTSTAGGELIFHIFASIAQFERRLISERSKAALAAGRARGRQGGRVAIMNDDAIRRAKGLLEDRKLSVREVARSSGLGVLPSIPT